MAKSSIGTCFQLATLLVMFIMNAALQTGPPRNLLRTTTLGTTYSFSPKTTPPSSQNNSRDESVASDPMYTRWIPAGATIGLFLAGVFIIYVYYCINQKENQKKEAEPIEDAQLNNDWLAELRKTQNKKSSFPFGRRGSTFQAKLKMKKYALYDDMLNRHKRALKMQKLHSMRKTNTQNSNMTQSTDSNDEPAPLKKVSSKLRIQEMAMRHKEQQSQMDFHLELPSRERHLPRWGTTTSSISQDDAEHRLKSTDSDFDTYRNFSVGTDRGINQSPTSMSFQTSTDDDMEPLITSPTRRTHNVHLMSTRRKAPPTSKNESKQSSIGGGESGESDVVEVSNTITTYQDDIIDDGTGDVFVNMEAADSAGQQLDEEDHSINILDQPDIKDALRKLSSLDEVPRRLSTSIRPKSMTAVLAGGNLVKSSADSFKDRDRVTQKRQSWYQGLFKSSKKNIKTASIDDLIDDQVNKAIYSRLVDTEYDEDEAGTSEEIRKRNPNLRQRPKSWMPTSENQRKKQSKRSDAITELFANLMDLPNRKREVSWYDNMQTSSNDTAGIDSPPQQQSPQHTFVGTSIHPTTMTEKEEMMLINEVERRMIENIDDEDILENEVMALENLLNDVAKFSSEYSEDYGDVESRRQISFSEANETLSRSKKSRSNTPKNQDSFDMRAAKVMSVYDTQLLQESKSNEPTTTL